MTASIVSLGAERGKDKGLGIGTVRRPPRAVPKTAFASGNWYDVWYPKLAPNVETTQVGQQAHFAVGCYCEDGSCCHRSVLRALLAKRGALLTVDFRAD